MSHVTYESHFTETCIYYLMPTKTYVVLYVSRMNAACMRHVSTHRDVPNICLCDTALICDVTQLYVESLSDMWHACSIHMCDMPHARCIHTCGVRYYIHVSVIRGNTCMSLRDMTLMCDMTHLYMTWLLHSYVPWRLHAAFIRET